MKNSIRLLPVLSLAVPAALSAAMSDFTALPPTQVPGTDPNVMINLSIETPMQGAAYNDQNDGGTCTGRPASEGGKNIGACYFKDQEYIGYFDPDKCYVYSTDHFAPSGAVGTDHECSGKWSGNMLNWATMTAIDEFRWALTGGHRSTDTATETRLQRANMGLSAGHSWFPVKKLQNPLNTNPNKVTPYNNSVLYITSTGTTINVGTTAGASDVASGLNVIVKVCDSTQGLEENCNAYGSNYKPEGLIQNNARNMRFAVMSYLNNADKNRHGGVLRANMKYVGPEMPATGGGFQTNANREWDAGSGVFVVNPDPTDAAASSVTNSGVINYINKFGANGYKSYDPIGELFYECLNYFRDKGPTSAFYSGATATEKDGFPVITNWIDPIQYSCQPNYIVGINDANPWLDKWLPGTSVVTGATYNNFSWSGNESAAPPSDTIDVTDLTNTVGELQGLNGTTFSIGCVPGNCDMVANNKLVNNLGEVFGTAPWAGKENSYYIAGLAYWGASQDIRTSADSNNIDGRQSIRTFMIDTQEYNANPLTGQTNMLWLAAKYGGFEESDKTDTNSDGNNYEPNLTAEWDADGDGEPDNYVLATNPQKLVSGLSRALSDIADRVSSGGAASVVSNDANGNSVMVRAYYQPMLNDNGSTVEWVGKLQAIFRDDFGNLREDSNGNKKLDDYATDFVIQTFFDETVTPNRARVQRMNTTDGINMTPTGTPIELEDLKVLWDSQDRLSDPTVDMKVQRAYTTNSSKQRHIFTWFDNNTDGSVDSGEITDFTSANISASNWTWLNTADETTAESIVDFIRGDEGNSAFRNRTIDNNNNGVTDSGDVVWRLGDVIDSSPVVVGPPSNPNIERLDSTYTDYRVAYQNRRMVAYVGANDGMVHAFNMGFLKTADTSFVTQLVSENPFAIGQELWAYVPNNLLPHLQWLADPDYSHVYYVNGPAQSFDVNIFTPSSTHPNGWGTILVVGMHLGGGPIDLDLDNDATNDHTARSSYMIFDVTDPESPPTLLGEINHANLGFTTSLPTVMMDRTSSTGLDFTIPNTNNWYLVFGSGPTDLTTATSTQEARIYLVDLSSMAMNSSGLGEANSFVGNIAAKDWDGDLRHDSVYFGTIGGTISTPTGKLMQMTSSFTRNVLHNPGKPIVGRPTPQKDHRGNRWVYYGSGRFFVRDDNESNATHYLYGIKDPLVIADATTGTGESVSTVSTSDMLDVTNIKVYSDYTIHDTDNVLGGTTSGGTSYDFSELEAAMDESTTHGWYRTLGASANPTKRSFTNSVYFREQVQFGTYTPAADICEPEGTSTFIALYYRTGTAFPNAAFGNSTTITNGSGGKLTVYETSPVDGVMYDTRIEDTSNGMKSTGDKGDGTTTVEDLNEVVHPGERQSWRQIEF